MRSKRIIATLAATLLVAAVSGPVPARANQSGKPDSIVRIYVEYRLAKDGILKNNNLHVNVAHGKITLTGTVLTLHDRSEAAKEAAEVADSYSVVNDLSVSTPEVPDTALARAVLKRVENHVFYTVFDWLKVSAKNGVVTLHGWVDNPWNVRFYADEAARVPGVKRIVNKLKVAVSLGYSKFRAARLIYSDPMYWGYSLEFNPPIHIIANRGTLILEGNVGSKAERAYLDDLLTFRTDAINVVNHLQISAD